MKDLYDFMKEFDLHTIIIVGVAFWWLNGSISEIKKDLIEVKSDLRVVKTVLIMKDMMPKELAKQQQE